MALHTVTARPPAAEKVLAASPGRIALKIAGFGLDFNSGLPGVISILKRRYGGFRAGTGGAVRFEVYGIKGCREPFKPRITSFGGSLEIRRGDFGAWIALREGTGNLAAAPNAQCFDAFLRSFISFLLIRSGGFMLHSAGLVKGGKAYLFLGRSGAGKSTLSKLAAAARPARRVEVISDEINLLRFESGRFVVHGSPFWGEMRAAGRTGSWPLGGIFLLRKAGVNRVAPCSKAEALKLLLRCLLNFDKNPGTAALIMRNSARLVSKAKFRRLEFSKDNADFLNLL